MKAEELRIGNIVDYHGNEVTINSINDTDVGFSDYVPIDYPLLDEIKPIPLTGERLFRLGFSEENVIRYIFRKGIFEVGLDGLDFAQGRWTVRINKCLMIKIRYIHELQNLYYALTGEELNYEKATQN